MCAEIVEAVSSDSINNTNAANSTNTRVNQPPPPQDDIDQFIDNNGQSDGDPWQDLDGDEQAAVGRVTDRLVSDQTDSDPVSRAANTSANILRDAGEDAIDAHTTAAQVAIDPQAAIANLNSEGDQVTMSLTGEGKVVVPVPLPTTPPVPVGVGGKGQYGYEISVQQVGNSQTPGVADDSNVSYDVTFSKELLGGLNIEPPIPYVDIAGERNGGVADQVTMSFDTQEEAAQAVDILRRTAMAETVRDIGNTGNLEGTLRDNPASNPLAEEPTNGLTTNPLEGVAQQIGPSAEESAFLADHITSYTTEITGQDRLKFKGSLSNFGIEARVDQNTRITRTVELPRDGEPGRVTYSLSNELDLSAKERLTLGKKNFDFFEAGYTPQNIVDIGAVTSEVSVSWEVDAAAFDNTVRDRPVPELDILQSGDWQRPDAITTTLGYEHTIQSPLDMSRTDLQRGSLELTLDNPRDEATEAANYLLQGDVDSALNAITEDVQVDRQTQTVRRDGLAQQHEVGFELNDLLEVKFSGIATLGIDDVIDLSNTPPLPEQNPQAEQWVVTPHIGLNARSQPGVDNSTVGTFYHGTFLEATGNRQLDAQGNEWLEVRGPDVNDHPVQGWVAAEYVELHPEGAMDATGRINPDLEAQGYQEHLVQPNDTIWDVAHENGVDFDEMVALNADHLIDPNMIFAGDTLYISGTASGQAPIEDNSAPPTTTPPTDRTDSTEPPPSSTDRNEATQPNAPTDRVDSTPPGAPTDRGGVNEPEPNTRTERGEDVAPTEPSTPPPTDESDGASQPADHPLTSSDFADTNAIYTVGEPTRPTINHDNGFLSDPNDPTGEPLPTTTPTDADRQYYNDQVWLARGGSIATDLGLPDWLIPDQYDQFLDSPDGIDAYHHFLTGNGADRTFSYDAFVEQDSAGQTILQNATRDLQVGVEDLYNQMIEQDPSLQGQPITFQVTGDSISTSSGSDEFPYPATDNWQKTIGDHTIWMSGTVTVTPSEQPGGQPEFSMEMTLHAEDRYNFNPDQHDIETGAPDALRGRLEEVGLAHQYMHYGTFDRQVTWTGGNFADTVTAPTSGGR